MAGYAAMKRGIFCLLDTSYLTELYKIDGKWSPQQNKMAKQEIASFIKESAKFFITAPVLFELAKHIAQAKNNNRYYLAKQFSDLVKGMYDGNRSFYIYPGTQKALLHTADMVHLANRFLTSGAKQQLSLADIDIIRAVDELHQKHPNHQIKILTFDKALGAHSFP